MNEIPFKNEKTQRNLKLRIRPQFYANQFDERNPIEISRIILIVHLNFMKKTPLKKEGNKKIQF